MVNLLGETNAPTKPRQTSTSETLDVFVSSTPSPKTTKTTSPKTIALDLIEVVTPKPTPTPTPIIPQPTPTPKDSGYGAYGVTDEEQTCPEGYSKNYNRQGKLECLPNYYDCGSPTMCTEDEEFVDCKCQKKRKSPETPNTPTTPTQVTKNLKPLIYGVGIIVGIIIISKLLKSN